jgi:hypothetical protein
VRASAATENASIFGDAVDIALATSFEAFEVVLETALGVLRTLISYLPLLFLFIFTVTAWYTVSQHTAPVVFSIDAVYESVRPNVVELFLQVLNFTRVVFALVVGIWNAVVDILLIPIRLLFDAGFECGGPAFVQNVALKGSLVVKEVANVLVAFAGGFAEDNAIDIDITMFSFRVREFSHVFLAVIECSCQTVNGQVLRVALAPVYSNVTDVFANSAIRTAMKIIEIPYRAMTSGQTSFEPLFDVALSENSGLLASGAALLNEQLSKVVEFIQIPVPQALKFGSPPVFSLVHRVTAFVLAAVRIPTRLITALPDILNENSRDAADTVYESASVRDLAFHAEKYVDVFFVDIFSSLHSYFREYGELYAAGWQNVINIIELSYNTTITAATGAAEPTHSLGHGLCQTQIRHSDNFVARIRYSVLLFARTYSERSVPLQIDVAAKLRSVLDKKFMMVALAETTYSASVTGIRFIQGLLDFAAYSADAVLRLKPVRHDCVGGFMRRFHEQAMDTLETLPNTMTSLLDIVDVTGSGYASLACARTTHVNHIYAGSLKSYIFASSACDVVFAKTGEMPKCTYRNIDIDKQNSLCKRLVAFADFNTNLVCNSGDAFVEILQTFYHTFRTVEEYNLGMFVTMWNCLVGDKTGSGFASCASSMVQEIIPPTTIFDTLECQSAELFYRASTMLVSAFSPLLNAIYIAVGYPDEGYVAVSADELQHLQAKPLEAALSSLITSLMVPHWAVHAMAHVGKELVHILEDMASGINIGDLVQSVYKFQFEVMGTILRVMVLALRDVLVGVLQVGRAISTMVKFSNDRGGDARLPGDDFMTFQTSIITVVTMAQDFVELFNEQFFLGIEALFECLFLLIKGITEGKVEYIREFFVTAVVKLGDLSTDILNGFMGILFQEGSPLHLVCSIVDSVKKTTCSMMGAGFIPTSMNIGCGTSKNACSWWPFNDQKTFQSGDVSGSSPDLSRINYVDGPAINMIEKLPDNKRRMLLFQRAMEEHDPEARRKLLLFDISLEQLFEKVADEVLSGPKDLFEKAVTKVTSIANAAKKKVNQAIDMAGELVDKVAKLPQKLWNSVYSIIPTKFDMKMSSIFELTKIKRESMKCDTKVCPVTDGAISCDASQEATVCSKDGDCNQPSSFCVTADQDLCGTDDAEINSNACVARTAWAKACGCKSLKYKTGNHCNYATGFCTAGDSPFVAPLTECSTSDQLVYGADDYNKLCYISPIWKCANDDLKDECRSRVALNELEGPSLCRVFCAPTFANRNNRLSTYTYADSGKTKCVCEVGVDRAFPDQAVNVYPTDNVTNVLIRAPETGRRRLLTNDKYSGAPHSVFTSCNTNAQCAPSFSNPTICKSLWTLPITCYSCSERVHGASFSRGYQCNAQSKTCECTAPVSVDPEDERDRPDDVDWRGDSWCDKIMRGYRHAAIRTPLENVWVHKCGRLREFGIGLTNWLGLQSVPPDVVYNPQRSLAIAMDLVHGLSIYFSEGWAEHDDEDEMDLENFFNRLIEKRVDPLLTFKFLAAGQKLMGISRGLLAQIDIAEIIGGTLDVILPEASVKFRVATNSLSNVTTGMINVIRDNNVSVVMRSVGLSMAPLEEFTNLVIAAAGSLDTNITRVNGTRIVHNITIANVLNHTSEYDTALDTMDPEFRTRVLLSSISDCYVLQNVKNRLLSVVGSMTEYYGSSDKFLGKSLCAYEHFLTGTSQNNACEGLEHGQSAFNQSLTLRINISQFESFKVSDLAPAKVQRSIDEWFSEPKEVIFRRIIDFTQSFSSIAVTCDADVLLCKKQTRSLLEAFVLAQVGIFIGLSAFMLSGINLLSISFFITSQFILMPPIVLYLTYGVLPSCFPRIPVCIGDDAFAVLLFFLPRHIPWSEHLVTNARRVPFAEFVWFEQLSADITNCRNSGFGGFFDVFFWARESARNSALNVLWFGAEWPLLRLASAAQTSSKEWRVREYTPAIDACGSINMVGIVPPLLLSFLCYLTLTFATVPILRLAVKSTVRVLPWITQTVLAMLDTYNT